MMEIVPRTNAQLAVKKKNNFIAIIGRMNEEVCIQYRLREGFFVSSILERLPGKVAQKFNSKPS